MLQRIPAIQNFLSNLTDGISVSQLENFSRAKVNQLAENPQNMRVVETIGKEKTAWWQA